MCIFAFPLFPEPRLAATLDIRPVLSVSLPAGVTAQKRSDGARDYIFLMNFTAEPQRVDVGAASFADLLSGEAVSGIVRLGVYGVRVLTQEG